jgi:hypothetical protein
MGKILPIEPMVRPWVNSRQPVQARQPESPPIEDDEGIPTLRWGAPMSTQVDAMGGIGHIVEQRDVEIERTTHDKRVENPADSGQFVDVEVIDEIKFRTPEGSTRVVVLDNPE